MCGPSSIVEDVQLMPRDKLRLEHMAMPLCLSSVRWVRPPRQVSNRGRRSRQGNIEHFCSFEAGSRQLKQAGWRGKRTERSETNPAYRGKYMYCGV